MIDRIIFQVENIFSIEGRGTVVVGELIEGIARKGIKTIINGKQSEILTIESHNKSLESLTTGVPAALLLSNIKKDDVQKGNTYHFQ
jgi:translation elongation factor EF-Tu-like GTPase